MNLGIAGKSALVFGGSKGMGRSCAQHLAAEGMQVVIAARTQARLEQAAAEISAQTGQSVRFVSADITTEVGRDAALDACPALDIRINNAEGTFSANPMTMTAGLVSMEMFDRAAVSKLNLLADRARARITEAIAIAGIPACVTGGGSMFRVHMKAEVPENYRATFASVAEAKLINLLLDHLFENGVIIIDTCSGTLSTVMTNNEIDRLADVMLSGFRKVKAALPPQA